MTPKPREPNVPISEYRVMWLMVLFDLPVMTKEQRRDYTRFRKQVLSMGFTQFQYSVYGKHLQSEAAGDPLKTHIVGVLPPEGQVRLLTVTDRQFGKMEVFSQSPPVHCTMRKTECIKEAAPDQPELERNTAGTDR